MNQRNPDPRIDPQLVLHPGSDSAQAGDPAGLAAEHEIWNDTMADELASLEVDGQAFAERVLDAWQPVRRSVLARLGRAAAVLAPPLAAAAAIALVVHLQPDQPPTQQPAPVDTAPLATAPAGPCPTTLFFSDVQRLASQPARLSAQITQAASSIDPLQRVDQTRDRAQRFTDRTTQLLREVDLTPVRQAVWPTQTSATQPDTD